MPSADLTADTFQYELNRCLISSCKCYKLTSETHSETMYNPDRSKTGCDNCVVEMPTGFLKVLFPPNTDILESGCSAAFLWTSKTKSLYVPDVSLQRMEQVTFFPIHVDFLPVLELFSSISNGDKHEHEYFLVPKLCALGGNLDAWKKSSCLTEINAMAHEASDSHIKAHKVMKYIVASMNGSTLIDHYNVKIISLHHFKSCKAVSNDFTKCVFEMFHELQRAYETGKLKSYCYKVNLLINIIKEERSALANPYKRILETLCCVTEEDTWSTYMHKLQIFALKMIEEERRCDPDYEQYYSVYMETRFAKLTQK